MVSIKNLIIIANKLDKIGYHKFSDTIDQIIKKVSSMQELEETESTDLQEEPKESIHDFFDKMLS